VRGGAGLQDSGCVSSFGTNPEVPSCDFTTK
jgi:hypothetical protein